MEANGIVDDGGSVDGDVTDHSYREGVIEEDGSDVDDCYRW